MFVIKKNHSQQMHRCSLWWLLSLSCPFAGTHSRKVWPLWRWCSPSQNQFCPRFMHAKFVYSQPFFVRFELWQTVFYADLLHETVRNKIKENLRSDGFPSGQSLPSPCVLRDENRANTRAITAIVITFALTNFIFLNQFSCKLRVTKTFICF